MTITQEQKQLIANEIMEMNIAGCYSNGTIECFSWEQVDEVQCWLEHYNLECEIVEHNIGGEFFIHITIKG